MNKAFGVVAEFGDPGELLHAAEKARDAGFKRFETYSPFPIHGMDDAMGIGQSKLGWLSLIGGLMGCLIGLGLQVWVSTSAYALVISGKPLASYPAFLPVTFELTILFTALFTVFGMFVLNGLPRWYHAIFNYSRFKKASCSGFFMSICASDAKYGDARRFLESIGATSVEEVEGE